VVVACRINPAGKRQFAVEILLDIVSGGLLEKQAAAFFCLYLRWFADKNWDLRLKRWKITNR
jgi:hypothetical protein